LRFLRHLLELEEDDWCRVEELSRAWDECGSRVAELTEGSCQDKSRDRG